MATICERDKSVRRKDSIKPCNIGTVPAEGKSTTCKSGCCFFLLQILQNKLWKLNQIQEACNIKTHRRQESTFLIFSATSVKKRFKAKSNQGST